MSTFGNHVRVPVHISYFKPSGKWHTDVETSKSVHRDERCPRCDSPSPERHPAMQHEGEVQPCPDPWHGPAGVEALYEVVSWVEDMNDTGNPPGLPRGTRWDGSMLVRVGEGAAVSFLLGPPSLDRIVDLAHINARRKGWWGDAAISDEGAVTVRNFGEILALIHSEVSEALEAWRNKAPFDENTQDMDLLFVNRVMRTPEDQMPRLIGHSDVKKPEGIASELADVIIRVADAAGAYRIPIAKAVWTKLAYNRTRPYRHGGKVA